MEYDIIIAGAGCAGLSLAYRLCDPAYAHLKVLLLDKDPKTKNDRTWCFWSEDAGIFNEVVYKQWEHIHFYSKALDKQLDIAPYKYFMIRGKDFYTYTKEKIKLSDNVSFSNERVLEINSYKGEALEVKTENNIYHGRYGFKSYLDAKPAIDKHWYVDQHFGGWFIETQKEIFDPTKATFMDFRINQEGETRFFYVLPISKTAGLVEMAVFSNAPLDNATYDNYIAQYIQEYIQPNSFQIIEKEYGIIPMTSYPFKENVTPNLYNIGTPAGAVKASAGYAFYRIQEHCDFIMRHIDGNKIKTIPTFFTEDRYKFYDKIMLNVMLTGKAQGEDIFTALFKKRPGTHVLKFLNQHTSFLEDLKLFTAPPWAAFTKAMLEEIKG